MRLGSFIVFIFCSFSHFMSYGDTVTQVERLNELSQISDRLLGKSFFDIDTAQKMCVKYPKGIACSRIDLLKQSKKACSCSKISPKETLVKNQEFLDYQKKRVEKDIKDLTLRLSPVGGFTHYKKWQISSFQKQLSKKKEILKRILRYIKELYFLPSVNLIVDDLAADFTPEDCGELVRLDDFKKTYKMSKMINSRSHFNSESETLKARCQADKPISLDGNKTEASSCIDCETSSSTSSLINFAQSKSEFMDKASCKLNTISCTNNTDDFLKSVGIDSRISAPPSSEKNLSHFFSQPDSQGKSFACAGFAMSADIEAELYKKSLGGLELPPPDPWDTYEVLNGGYSACQGKVEGRSYSSGTIMGPGLANLGSSSLCAKGLDRRYKVKGTSSLNQTDSVDFNFVKTMIDNEKPFVAGLNSVGAKMTEDWSEPIASSDATGHVLTVVGYGNGMSPKGNSSEPYVIVRDSLNGEPIHTKMRFEDFKSQLSGIWKVQSVSFE